MISERAFSPSQVLHPTPRMSTQGLFRNSSSLRDRVLGLYLLAQPLYCSACLGSLVCSKAVCGSYRHAVGAAAPFMLPPPLPSSALGSFCHPHFCLLASFSLVPPQAPSVTCSPVFELFGLVSLSEKF